MKVKAVACYNKNNEERLKSSSGGIYTLIAREILKQQGIVFAAAYSGVERVEHIAVLNEKELEQTRGSKYIPSDLQHTFQRIKELLCEDKIVMFVGTACQCMGLKSYLKNAGCNTEKLLLVDFVCHGVPSKNAWRAFLETQKQKGYVLERVNMRDKSTGWSRYQYAWELHDDNGSKKCVPQEEVSFMKGFVNDLYLRPSCYDCRFKGINRMADITLGDYWGVWDLQPDMDDNKGTSLVLIHSNKGMSIMESIKNSIVSTEVDLNNAVRANPSIEHSAAFSQYRTEFFQRMHKCEDFDYIVNSLVQKKAAVGVKQKISRLFKKRNVGEVIDEKKKKCCGCTACYALCPVQAIEMIEDEEGFEYPNIDKGKCLDCSKCINVCPVKSEQRYNEYKMGADYED